MMYQVKIDHPMHGGLYFFETNGVRKAIAMALDFCPDGRVIEAKAIKEWNEVDGFICEEEFVTDGREYRPTLAPMAAYD